MRSSTAAALYVSRVPMLQNNRAHVLLMISMLQWLFTRISFGHLGIVE